MTAEPITDLATAVEVMGALPMPAGPAAPQTLKPLPSHLVSIGQAGSEYERALYAAYLQAMAEVGRLRDELAARMEDIAFTDRATIPELRRTIQHHEDGKKRWRDRAEKAEPELAAQTRYASLLEAVICQCEPLCEDGEYLHVADCPVVEIQMRSFGCPGFESNPVAPDQCAGCGETNDAHEEAGR